MTGQPPTWIPIVFREDGYINVTKIAQHFGKRPVKFFELPGTSEYMSVLAEALNVRKSDLLFSSKGRYGGTWLHPKAAVYFMRWLDVPFSVRADLLIDNILRGNIGTSVQVPTLEAQQLKAES